jgi:heme exporter protein CcmB
MNAVVGLDQDAGRGVRASRRLAIPALPGGWLGHALAIAGRDARREARTGRRVVGAGVLALLILLACAFALGSDAEQLRAAAPGVLWVAVVFSGALAAGPAFADDAEHGTLEGLLLAPVDRSAVFAGKLVGTAGLMGLVECALLPAAAVLFDAPLLRLDVVAALAVSTVGFAALATLLGAAAVGARGRELLVPVLALPLATPLLIAGAQATGSADAGQPWLPLALAAAAVYVGGGLLLIDHALEEST